MTDEDIRRMNTPDGAKKMSDSSPFLILEQPCDDAIDWVARQMSNAGLQVVRTFDLHVARHALASCTCPHHGTDQCDCQMVVLLVYGSGGHKPLEHQPVSMVAHGHNGHTWFSVVDTPQQRADPHLEATIRHALSPYIHASLNLENLSHAA
jgi:hypothetical protein